MPSIPKGGNKRGEELGIDAPVPVTGQIDTEETVDFRTFTCMWQYLYPNQEDNPDWFVSTTRNNLAQNINTELEHREWHNPEDIQIATRMNTTQVQQLNQEWQVDGDEQQDAEDQRVLDVEEGGTIEDIVGRVLEFIF